MAQKCNTDLKRNANFLLKNDCESNHLLKGEYPKSSEYNRAFLLNAFFQQGQKKHWVISLICRKTLLACIVNLIAVVNQGVTLTLLKLDVRRVLLII